MNFGSHYTWLPKNENDDDEEVFEDDLCDGIESSHVRDESVQQNNNNNNNNDLLQFNQNQPLLNNNVQQQQQNPFVFNNQQNNNVQQQGMINNQYQNNNPFNFQQLNNQPQQNQNQNQNPFLNNNLQQKPQQYNYQKVQRKNQSTKKVKGANTNVVGLELGKLGEQATVATGDAQFCEGCKSMLNSHSILSKKEENSIDKKWNCEFCGVENSVVIDEEEIPKEDTLDYLLEPAPELNDSRGDSNTILFLVDISGSMCVTTEVQGKIELKGGFDVKDLNLDTGGENQWMPNQRNRNVTYISRLQCVQASIEKQIQTFVKDNPNKKVGLITFNNEITVIGDGTSQPVTISGDKLSDFDKLLEEGAKLNISNTVSQTHKELINKLYKLQESGTTALGPALVVALGMISKLGKGNTVVLLTDGLANIGVGSMEELYTEEQQQNAQNFFRRVGDLAQQNGTTISITGIEGSECKMEYLGLVSELSGGEVDIVNPLELTNNFANILSKTIVATECNLIFKVHRGLKIKDDENEQGGDTLSKNVGNVTNDLVCTFEYSLKSLKELKELDLEKLKELPFQVQIYYRDTTGAKKVRCITKQQKITNDRQEAENEIDMNVISANAVQFSAKLAQKGKYKEAREKMVMNQKMMSRNVSSKPQQQQFYEGYVNQAVLLDNALLEEEQTEQLNGDWEYNNNNNSNRSKKRNDKVSKQIYQAKKYNHK
eukprot:TRINITY_DN222_c0_g3_i1.p1 TRINITY_DN222_c0_g3~~TRINITY_DN222_c0_g3_i1.p1  ORF type:complete len:714 (-),score=288.87 TRINITY_DN222_c0_g3_i1:43-2184(-)